MADRKQGESRSNTNQRLPSGHFDSNGKSQGSAAGAVRPTHDAHNTNSERQEQQRG
jgi:hypothetical protein